MSSETGELNTVPLPTPEDPPGEGRARGRWLRGFTGSLAAGLVVLAVVVLGAGVLGLVTGAPGPGLFLLIGHPVAAILALAAQRVADRKRGFAAGAGMTAVLVITGLALWLLWLT